MLSLRPTYAICPGDRIEVEVVQPDGGRALVVGKLDAVLEAADGPAPRIVVCDAQVQTLPAAGNDCDKRSGWKSRTPSSHTTRLVSTRQRRHS
jgi:hypothetical protein